MLYCDSISYFMYSGFCYIGEPWLLEQYIFNKMTWIYSFLETVHNLSLNPFNSTISETFTNLGNSRFTSSNAFLRHSFRLAFFEAVHELPCKPLTTQYNKQSHTLFKSSIDVTLFEPPYRRRFFLSNEFYNELYNDRYNDRYNKRILRLRPTGLRSITEMLDDDQQIYQDD